MHIFQLSRSVMAATLLLAFLDVAQVMSQQQQADVARIRRDGDEETILPNGRRGKIRRVKKLRQQPANFNNNNQNARQQQNQQRPAPAIQQQQQRQPKAIDPRPQQVQAPQIAPPVLPIQPQVQQIRPIPVQAQQTQQPIRTSFVPNSISREVKSNSLPPVPIHSQDFKIDDFGNYQFNFQTGDQVQRVENGQQVIRENEKFQAIEGSYSYTGPDGKTYTVRYIADENGFQPIGDHIPRLPRVPRKN